MRFIQYVLKFKRRVAGLYSAFFLLIAGFLNPVYADVRVREFEGTFLNVLYFTWSISIVYFTYRLIMIGAKWMLSFGDPQKLADLKKGLGSVVMAFVVVFGGWLVANTIIVLLGIKDPEDCFAEGSEADFTVVFHFFFPTACGD